MATIERCKHVVRDSDVMRLIALQSSIEQLKFAQHSYLQRTFMILRDYHQTGEASTHLGLTANESGNK